MDQQQLFTVTIITNQSPEMAEFGISEMISLFDLFGVPYQELFKNHFKENEVPAIKDIHPNSFTTFPFIDVQIKDPEVINLVLSRSILIHDILYTCARAEKLEDLAKNIFPQAEQYLYDAELTCKIDIITSYFKLSQPEKVEFIDKVFTQIACKNKVNLKDPDIIYYLIMPKEGECVIGYTLKKKKKRRERNFARDFELPNRIYLGPVSLAHDIAFLMANQAQVKENDFVLDPFAGTGSALVTCAHFGALCFGAEIDGYLLQGYAIGYLNKQSSYYKEELAKERPYVNHNFSQYGLPKPCMIRTDVNSRNYSHVAEGFFDSIICDPPYGIRASIKQEDLADKAANRTAIYKQMFTVARRLLRRGGRLVYLYPIWKATYKMIESEEGFDLVDYREQVLADKRSRLLVTMQKQ